jgi:hypothetical protein
MSDQTDGAALDDRALVLRMRAGEEDAFREFFLRFEPLLQRLTQRARTQHALRRETVDEALGRIALALARPTSVTPDRLAAYVATAFLGPVRDAARATARHERLTAAAMTEVGGASRQLALAETCSQASLRASDPAYGEGAPRSAAFEGLLALVRRETSDEERRVLGWLAERVPQRLIAEWSGTTHDAMRKRVLRLRARMRRVVLEYVTALPDAERAPLLRVLGRGPALGAGEGAVPICQEER